MLRFTMLLEHCSHRVPSYINTYRGNASVSVTKMVLQ